LSQVRLARLTNISGSMLRDFEKGRRKPTTDELEAIRCALEAKGVSFGEGNGDGPGVRLRKADGVIRATLDPPRASPRK
jgi:transcriptional regulator with XRE-family HTH domain